MGSQSSKGGAHHETHSRPEPLTDQQIVYRLNSAVKKSEIFKKLFIRKFPRRIIRKDKQALLNKKTMKHLKKQAEKEQKGVIEEEIPSGEDDEEEKIVPMKGDYFLDAPIDGDYHISLAKNESHKRHKDRVEWSGQDIIPRFDPFKARVAVG